MCLFSHLRVSDLLKAFDFPCRARAVAQAAYTERGRVRENFGYVEDSPSGETHTHTQAHCNAQEPQGDGRVSHFWSYSRDSNHEHENPLLLN